MKKKTRSKSCKKKNDFKKQIVNKSRTPNLSGRVAFFCWHDRPAGDVLPQEGRADVQVPAYDGPYGAALRGGRPQHPPGQRGGEEAGVGEAPNGKQVPFRGASHIPLRIFLSSSFSWRFVLTFKKCSHKSTGITFTCTVIHPCFWFFVPGPGLGPGA